MKQPMSVLELKTAIREGKFEIPSMLRPTPLKPDYVFDENQSVKWNREEVVRVNQKKEEKYAQYVKEARAMKVNEYETIIRTFADYSLQSLARVERAYNFAYSQKSSNGIIPVLEFLEELLDLFDEINDIN